MPTFECPTCRTSFTVAQKADAPFRPFCSNRCKMVDLGRWLDGTYTVSEPGAAADPDSVDASDD